jgi:hypothetical protein
MPYSSKQPKNKFITAIFLLLGDVGTRANANLVAFVAVVVEDLVALLDCRRARDTEPHPQRVRLPVHLVGKINPAHECWFLFKRRGRPQVKRKQKKQPAS